jgi:molybdate transport system permease protein
VRASAGTTRLTPRHRARRAGRGTARSAPLPLLAPGLVALAFLILPLIGLVIRAPWGRMGTVLSGTDALQALELSLWTATVATAVALVIGVPLAWLLARTVFVGQRLVRALVTLPLVLPPVVGGVALLLVFGRAGFIGRLLNSWFGLLGAGSGGIRGHHHVRRKFSRTDGNDADRGVLRAGNRPRCRDRAQPYPAVGIDSRFGIPA